MDNWQPISTLGLGQAMAVRVAISYFHMEVSDPEFAAALGPIAEGYRAKLEEVLRLMIPQRIEED